MKALKLLLLAFLFLSVWTAYALSRPGQWASSGDPEIDKWFSEQRVLGTSFFCCSIADGEFVEEDIRDGHYWIRWTATKGEWVAVPDEAVINQSNKWGLPAVWWGIENDEDGVFIKCYVPGAKS